MPRNLVAETLRKGLYTRVIGRRILFFQELGSTMDEAARQADLGAEEGTVVIAETQTASRGRFGRTWVSQAGNLYLSVALYPSLAALPYLSCLGGLAVVRAIQRTTRLQPRIKWPNDVLVGGAKVAGILAESVLQGGEVKHAILGIGINVGLDPHLIEELPTAATSLNVAAGTEVAREELLGRLLHEFDALYIQLKQGQNPLAEWKELLDTLGQRVTVLEDTRSYEGLAEDIDDLGNLLLRLDSGHLVTLTAGDVTLRG